MADKSDFGQSTVNEYLSDELTSNSDDEKRMYKLCRLALFLPSDLWCYYQAISNILQDFLAIFVSCFLINFW